jgi:hypothetical protein
VLLRELSLSEPALPERRWRCGGPRVRRRYFRAATPCNNVGPMGDAVMKVRILASEAATADEKALYPIASPALAKRLRESGLEVEFADAKEQRAYLELRAADLILPILVFTSQALASGAGDLLAGAVREMFGKTRGSSRGRLVLQVGREDTPSGQTLWFKGSGSQDDVLKAFKLWCETQKND